MLKSLVFCIFYCSLAGIATAGNGTSNYTQMKDDVCLPRSAAVAEYVSLVDPLHCVFILTLWSPPVSCQFCVIQFNPGNGTCRHFVMERVNLTGYTPTGSCITYVQSPWSIALLSQQGLIAVATLPLPRIRSAIKVNMGAQYCIDTSIATEVSNNISDSTTCVQNMATKYPACSMCIVQYTSSKQCLVISLDNLNISTLHADASILSGGFCQTSVVSVLSNATILSSKTVLDIFVALTVYYRQGTSSCLLSSQAVIYDRMEYTTEKECFAGMSLLLNGLSPRCEICVIQYNSITMECMMFALQDVCPDVYGTVGSCPTYVNVSVTAMRAKFAGVWQPSVIPKPGQSIGMNNLICSPGRQINFINRGVVFNNSEAQFLGTANSWLDLNNTADFPFTSGMTYVMRMKRKPQSQPYMELYDCSSGAYGTNFWEWNGLYFSTEGTLPSNIRLTASMSVAQNQWAEIGFTANFPSYFGYYYLGGQFLSTSATALSSSSRLSSTCIRIGNSNYGSYYLQGSIKLIAMSNEYRTNTEIADLFNRFRR